MGKTTKQWVDPMGSTISFQQHKVASLTISGITELADLTRNQNHDVTMELKRDNTKLDVTIFNAYKTATEKTITNLTNRIKALETANTQMNSKITTLETANTQMDSKITALETVNTQMNTQLTTLTTRVEALESAGGESSGA